MPPQESWAKVSVGLATFAFVNLVLFLTLSQPLDLIFGTIHNVSNQTNATVGAQMFPILTMCRTIFGLTFVLSMAGLIIWFFLGSHREEYEQS